MIIKSFEIKKNLENFLQQNIFLLYGENLGLKRDIKKLIYEKLKKKNEDIETLIMHENEIIDNEENFYNFIFSASLFNDKKIITILQATDKVYKKIENIYDKYPDNVTLILFSEILEKKSKLRSFFEKKKKTVCVPCYLDSEKDLRTIALSELKKNNILLSGEILSLLIEKSNFDRDNLRNEIEKIKSYSLSKGELKIDHIKSLINFSGDYKSDSFINECLCRNIIQYKKILSELYGDSFNQIFLLRTLSNKVQRLIKIKENENKSKTLDDLINSVKPAIFWKEKPLVKKQLSIWNFNELKKIANGINNTELLCKKNPQVSKAIFFNFFLKICTKANSFS